MIFAIFFKGFDRLLLARHNPPRGLIKAGLCLVAGAPLLAGCVSMKPGPDRPITIEEDVANIRRLAEPDVLSFATLLPGDQAFQRNQIITARMYITDIEYHKYEALLTKEIQEEGLAATLVSLGLTGSASVITVASTGRILSAAATAVTGADKAYSEKALLSNTIQALQAQMRADRKTEAAEIFAKMLLPSGAPTPISQYTLAMALSDVDHYYQAGTLASALVGLNKTVSSAEHAADVAKVEAGPNSEKVAAVKEIARPSAPTAGGIVRHVAVAATDTSYTQLRLLLFPNGKLDPELRDYAKRLVGPGVPLGIILTTNPNFATLRNRISACIISHKAGTDCPDNSLAGLAR